MGCPCARPSINQAFDSPAVGGLVIISYLERQSDQGSFHGHVGILGEVRAARIRSKGIIHQRHPIKLKVMSPKTVTKKYPNLDRGLAFDASLEGKQRC